MTDKPIENTEIPITESGGMYLREVFAKFDCGDKGEVEVDSIIGSAGYLVSLNGRYLLVDVQPALQRAAEILTERQSND